MTDDTENAPRPVRDQEIASTRDGIDITRGYCGPLLVPADRVLRDRGNSDLVIYEQILSEPQVMSCFRDRRNAVVQCEWQVDAASDRRVDKKAAEHLRQQLQRVGFDRVTNLMLYGVFYGYAVAELLYGVEDGKITWDAIKVRNRRRFRFTPEGELRMLTMHNMWEGVELPPTKFWHYATGADNDDEPYGLGLAHWCYWPVLFKRNGVKFWLTFMEKFAAPTVVGRYDPATQLGDQNKLLAATQAVQTDSGVVMPKGMEMELIEAARSGSVDYKALHDTMDATLAKAIIGQTASSQGTPGKLGDEQLQSDVRDDLITADADLVCESLNLGPVRWLTRWNFPDADPPRVYRVTDEDEDLTERAERDKTIAEFGFRPTLKYVVDVYGGEWEEKEPPAPLIDVPAAQAPPVPSFAAPAAAGPYVPPDLRDLEALLDAIEQGDGQQGAARELLQPLLDAAASDADTFATRLASLYPELDDTALADTLDRLLFAAEAWGALNADRR